MTDIGSVVSKVTACGRNVQGCPLLTPGTMIVGYCKSTSELFSKANAEELVKIIGTLITEESKKHRDLAKTLTEDHAEAMRKLLIEFGAAQEVERAFGAGARSFSACTSASAGTSMRQGEVALRGYQDATADDDRRYNLSGQSESQMLQRLLHLASLSQQQENWRHFEYRALFGNGVQEGVRRSAPGSGVDLAPNALAGTLTGENLQKARDYVQTVTAPAPLPRLPEPLARTPVGQKYEAARLVWQSEISGPQWVLNEILAMHGDLIDADGWLQSAWEDLGYDPSVLARTSGGSSRVSKSDYYQLMSMSRIGNNKWHNRVAAQMNEAGLLREIAMMLAGQLEMERDQLNFLQHIAGMMAMERASEVNRTTGAAARALLGEAISQRAVAGDGIPAKLGETYVPKDESR